MRGAGAFLQPCAALLQHHALAECEEQVPDALCTVENCANRVAGSAALTREDLQPALDDMQRKLMERNVAEEIAVQVRRGYTYMQHTLCCVDTACICNPLLNTLQQRCATLVQVA